MLIPADLSPVRNDVKLAVVTSRFNPEVTEKLEQGALARLEELGIKASQIYAVRVAGAVEIPLATQWLLEAGCSGAITLGAVIRGETAHFDYVCRSVERGVSQLQLKFNRPVVFGVLTTDTEEQALARTGGSMGHKGREAADVLLEMLNLKNSIQKLNTKLGEAHEPNSVP